MIQDTTASETADDIAVSSFCFVRQLGPIRFESRDADGAIEVATLPLRRRHSLEEWAELVRDRLSTRALEVCQIQIEDPDPRRISGLRDRLDELGMSVRTVPIDFGDLGASDAVTRAADVEHLLGWFDLAKALDASFVRVNAGSPMSGAPIDGDGLRDALRALSDGARERGMQLLVENHGGPSSDPDVLLSLRDDVDGLGILLDLGNFEPLVTVSRARFMGEDPATDDLQVEAVYWAIGELAHAAALVHVKAFDPRADGSPLLDVDRALAIVGDAGYRGPYTIEWEGQTTDPWEATGRLMQQVRTVRGS